MARTALGKVEEAVELARRATQIAKISPEEGAALKQVARLLLKRAVKQFRRKVRPNRST